MENLYLILNVSPDADPDQIRQAYRVLSLQCHPDAAGPDREQDFLRLKEAYDTLSDAERRSRYDRELAGQELLRSRRRSARRPQWPSYPMPPHLFESFATHDPALDELAAMMLRNFTQRGVPKSHPVCDVELELIVTPEEAARGGVFPLEVPVPEVCAICTGTGRTGYFHCDACDGEGSAWASHRIDVLIPRHAHEGTMIPVSLSPLGIRNLRLNVRVRIAW